MTKHEKVTNELLHLIAQHPDRPVFVSVPTEGIVAGDEFAWWSAQFRNVKLDQIYIDPRGDGRVYTRDEDEDELIEYMTDDEYSKGGIDDDETYARAKVRLESLNWKNVIAVEIEAWEG